MKQLSIGEATIIARDETAITEMTCDTGQGKVAYVDSDGWIWIYDPAQDRSTQLVQGQSPEWQADGESILFEREWNLYSCPVAEDSTETKLLDRQKIGDTVRLAKPRVSPNGDILIQCHNVFEAKSKIPRHFYALLSPNAKQHQLTEVPCARSDAAWDKEGQRFLVEGWEGDNAIRIVRRDLTIEARFKLTLGAFSPSGQQVATQQFGSNVISVIENQQGQWRNVHSFACAGKQANRNRPYWLSESMIIFEADYHLHVIDIETGEISQIGGNLLGLTRRGTPSISWYGHEPAFVYEASENGGVVLKRVKLDI
jgi:hypothetical protein